MRLVSYKKSLLISFSYVSFVSFLSPLFVSAPLWQLQNHLNTIVDISKYFILILSILQGWVTN